MAVMTEDQEMMMASRTVRVSNYGNAQTVINASNYCLPTEQFLVLFELPVLTTTEHCI